MAPGHSPVRIRTRGGTPVAAPVGEKVQVFSAAAIAAYGE